MLPVKYLVAIVAACASHTCVVNGGGYHGIVQEELVPTQTQVETPCPEIKPLVVETDVHALNSTATLHPELVAEVPTQGEEHVPVQTDVATLPDLPAPTLHADVESGTPMVEQPTQDGEHVEVQVDVTPCPELPVPTLHVDVESETPMVEVPTQDGEHVEVQVDVTPCPELPVPTLHVDVESETPMVEVPTQDGEHVEVQVDVAPELPVPPIQTQTDAETPVMETPVHEEEHVGVQPETPDPDVALVPETSPLQTEDTSVPETVREETVGEYPIPAPMVPCPAFTLVPETAPEEMIGEYATPAMETPCPVFTLVPELEPSRVETTIEAHPDLTHVQQETSPESDTPMTGDVLEPHFTGAQVGNSGTEQTDEVVVVEDSTGPMQLAMDQMDQSASPMQSAMDQVDQSASPMQSAVDQVDQSTSPMQSAMDPTDQSTGFFDTGVDAIVETPEDVADAITADPTDIITTN